MRILLDLFGAWLAILVAISIIALSLWYANDKQLYGMSITKYDIEEILERIK